MARLQQQQQQEQQLLVLLLVKGHPGVGKSTLARHLCQRLSWPLIDKDDTRDCLQALPEAALQLFDANRLSYDVMFRHVASQLSLGISTVVDCPLARVELFDQAAAIAQQHGAIVAVVDCIAGDAARWQQQVEARAAAQPHPGVVHKPQSWQQMQQLLQRYDGCWRWSLDGSRSLQHHLLLDTTAGSLQENLQRVLQFVAEVMPNSEQAQHKMLVLA
ncbi:AAA domain-containing protein [Scenedesmus sp. NREL 46B-D3]|nr:AAA domain-containing protein [Scenedesmus sp. NREL 46B-D3]